MDKNMILHWANLVESEDRIYLEQTTLEDPKKMVEFIKSLPNGDSYLFKDGGKWVITSEWIAGSFGGRSFTGDTPEFAAEQLIEYFNDHVGHDSIVGNAVDNSGWPDMDKVQKYYDLNFNPENPDDEDEEVGEFEEVVSRK